MIKISTNKAHKRHSNWSTHLIKSRSINKLESKPNELAPSMTHPLIPKYHQVWNSINQVLLPLGDTNQLVQKRTHRLLTPSIPTQVELMDFTTLPRQPFLSYNWMLTLTTKYTYEWGSSSPRFYSFSMRNLTNPKTFSTSIQYSKYFLPENHSWKLISHVSKSLSFF